MVDGNVKSIQCKKSRNTNLKLSFIKVIIQLSRRYYCNSLQDDNHKITLMGTVVEQGHLFKI